MSKINKKFLFPVISVIMLAVLGYLIFKISYSVFIGKSYSSYEGTIKAYVTKIDNINNIDFKKDLNTETISPLVKTLDEKISSLSKIKGQIVTLNPTEKYKGSQQSLLSGIDTNILIYKQIQGILNNPKGSDLENSAKSLANYRDKTKSSYNGAQILSKIGLTDSLSAFIEKIIGFSNENSRVNKDNEIKTSQREDFINSVSDVINKFINVKKDFYADAYNIRNAKGNLADVLVSISSNKDSFKAVKSSFSKISVPASDAYKTYTSLKNLLNSYDSYLQSISFSVNTEITRMQSSSSPLSSSEIDSIYKESKTAYSLISKNYNSFITCLEDLKNQK